MPQKLVDMLASNLELEQNDVYHFDGPIDLSRVRALLSIDRPALKELPSESYQYAEWKRCGVAPDYHVEVDDHYYSVPFRLLRETVEARLTDTTIEITTRQAVTLIEFQKKPRKFAFCSSSR